MTEVPGKPRVYVNEKLRGKTEKIEESQTLLSLRTLQGRGHAFVDEPRRCIYVWLKEGEVKRGSQSERYYTREMTDYNGGNLGYTKCLAVRKNTIVGARDKKGRGGRG